MSKATINAFLLAALAAAIVIALYNRGVLPMLNAPVKPTV